MAQVEIIGEREAPGGWTYEVQVLDDAGSLSRHEVRLSWADYNHWSPTGGATPTRVVEAVVGLLLARDAVETLRPRFDASLVRRLHRDADAILVRAVRPTPS